MESPESALGAAVWNLPPLILHPFNERLPASAILEHSKAALMLSGLLPGDGSDPEELQRRILSGKYAEIRMLFFLGRDVVRWLGQCLEWTGRQPELCGLEIRRQSYAGLLTGCPPEKVKAKLIRWGVVDYVSIFRRAIGLNAVFSQPPAFDRLSDDFLSSYHRYADGFYRCYMETESHRIIGGRHFEFELYASGEYSRLLEAEWGCADPQSSD